jgi:hypothetical protein
MVCLTALVFGLTFDLQLIDEPAQATRLIPLDLIFLTKIEKKRRNFR